MLSVLIGPTAFAYSDSASIQQHKNASFFSRAEPKLYALALPDSVAATSEAPSFVLAFPEGMAPVASAWLTVDPLLASLHSANKGFSSGFGQRIASSVKGRFTELPLVQAEATEASLSSALLVQTIDTSAFDPPSPDPAGVVYLASSNTLLIADCEVDETPLFTGDNLFESTLAGDLIGTSTTFPFSREPTGVDYDPNSGHLFLSDDHRDMIFEIASGSDGLYGTGDDIITSFSTAAFGSYDPEGVAFAEGLDALFIVDDESARVYKLTPGTNGIFDGVPPDGDDAVTSFDMARLGMTAPEGITFKPENGLLYVVGRPRTKLAETTTEGMLLRMIDISAANAVHPAGLAFGPGSNDPGVTHLYITDRGIDNNTNPDENDGKVYEMRLPPPPLRVFLPFASKASRP